LSIEKFEDFGLVQSLAAVTKIAIGPAMLGRKSQGLFMENEQNNPPAAIWQTELEQTVIQPPQVVGKTVLLATQSSRQRGKHTDLTALSLADGTVRWQHSFEYGLVSGMQAYRLLAEGEDIAVVATGSSNLLRGRAGVFAFDQAGEIFWQWQGDHQHYSAPVVMDRQLLFTAGARTLAIVSPEEGGDSERHIPLDVNASGAVPAVHQGIVFIPCRSPEVLAIDLNGTVRWHFQFETVKRDWLNQTPLVTDKFIYIVSSLGKLFALETDSGSLVWQEAIGDGRPLSTPVLAGTRLFAGSRHGLLALDAASGRVDWKFGTTRAVTARPLVQQNTIYVASEDHHLYALDIESGQEQWRLALERRLEMPPVLSDTALLVADRGGAVLALNRPVVPEIEEEVVEAEPPDPEVILAQQKETAVALAAGGEHLQAAQLWHELGDLEKAAEAYELAGEWLEAANLWLQLDRYGKRANAYEKYARFLSKQAIDDEEKAVAWEHAARAYVETGQKEERLKCEREVSRYRRQPIITLEVEQEEMTINVWSSLKYSLRNDGFGIARFVFVSLKDERYSGKSGRTRTTPTITPGNQFEHSLDICPRTQGSSVPLRLAVEYTDKSNQIHRLERTFSLAVAGEAKTPTTSPMLQTPDYSQYEAAPPAGIQLSRKDFDRLAGIMAQMPEFRSISTRSDFFLDVFIGTPIHRRVMGLLDLDGSPRLVAVRAITQLASFGQDKPGHETLALLLNRLLEYMGGGPDADFLRGLFDRYRLGGEEK
jgi:outer membrane protein assembly factor BamB